MRKNNLGFTLIELVAVMAIASTLFGFIIVNLIGSQRRVSLTSSIDVLVSDMASQQTKAMLGAGSSSGISYGIYFLPDRYILFKGDTYSALDSDNFTVNLDQGITFSQVQFPAGIVVFTSATGTVSGYLNGSNFVTMQDTQEGSTKTITVNRYGVVTGVN